MNLITDFFKVHKAASKAFSDHERGVVPFVTNGFGNNGILGYVEPLPKEKVFNFNGICVSAFGEATVQYPAFIARGNGGSGLTILEPLTSMTKMELYWYASYINHAIRWRFSFGRMLKKDRLEKFWLPSTQKINVTDFRNMIPHKPQNMKFIFNGIHWKKYLISSLFSIKKGDFHSLTRLNAGDIMTISRIADNQGIAGYFEKPKKAKVYNSGDITVSTLDGSTFIQMNPFIATDNVLILTPLKPMTIPLRYFIVWMLNRDKWRYSYGRQADKTKFEQTEILLPVNDSEIIDESLVNAMLEQSTYWHLVKNHYVGFQSH